MKGAAVMCLLLILGTCLIVPTGTAANTKTNANAPIWGKTYTDSTTGSETRRSYYFPVHANDNITINTTMTNSYAQIWFGGISSDTSNWTQLPLPSFYYNSASNNISGLAPDAATSGLIDSDVNFWIVSGMDQMMMIVIRMYAATSFQYTINKINATDPIIGLQDQIDDLTMDLENQTAELISMNIQLDWLSIQLVNLHDKELNDTTGLQTLIDSIKDNLSTNIEELRTMMDNNDTISMDRVISNMTEMSGRISLLNSTLIDRISNMPKYNDTPIWDEINKVKQPINNTTFVNQTMVNQTVVNKTEVQPMTYINKTVEKTTAPDYLMTAIVGIIGGLIGGLIIGTILIRRKKPEISYMKNVEPPEDLKDQMMSVRKLQSEESEAEVSAGDSLEGKSKSRGL